MVSPELRAFSRQLEELVHELGGSSVNWLAELPVGIAAVSAA